MFKICKSAPHSKIKTNKVVSGISATCLKLTQTLYNKIVTGTIDSTGSYSQLSTLGPNDQMIFTTDLIPTSDGNFYAAGFTNINGARNSFGLKFAPNGDSLWMRYYYHEDQPDHSQVEIFFETPDSGFIHAGYYVDLFQSAGTFGGKKSRAAGCECARRPRQHRS